jgi:hypothetical protein
LAHEETPLTDHNSPHNYHDLTIKKPHFPTAFSQTPLKNPSNIAKLRLSNRPQFFPENRLQNLPNSR